MTPDAEKEGDWLSLTVSDNGAGISKGILPHIFELFTQGEHKPGAGASGLGIGLALAKHLVEMHGGSNSRHERWIEPRQCIRHRVTDAK
jgi:signal transduction histidine kinase